MHGILLSLPFDFPNNNLFPDAHNEDAEPPKVGVSYYKMLIDPIFMANVITAMLNWTIIGFNETTLEPSLTEVR